MHKRPKSWFICSADEFDCETKQPLRCGVQGFLGRQGNRIIS